MEKLVTYYVSMGLTNYRHERAYDVTASSSVMRAAVGLTADPFTGTQNSLYYIHSRIVMQL